MTLVPLPAFADNYIWTLQVGTHVVVVDPGDARPVLDWLALRPDLTVAAILVTHHHGDHTGGVAQLRDATGAAVFGPATEKIPEPFTPCEGGQRVSAAGLPFEVIDVPGHTAGHIAYWLPADAAQQAGAGAAPLLFCGDTLFSGGCGRLFEGTPAQMLASLDALAALPDDTRVCCAHEYTLSNLRFARAVEPTNAELARYTEWCEAQRAAGLPTLPAELKAERQINPFLRSREACVTSAVRQHATLPADADEVAVFGALRQWKNDFR